MAPATWRTGGPRAHAVAPGLQLGMGIGHGRAHAIAEDLRHVEGDVGVGVAAGQPFLVGNRLLHPVIEGERGGARLDGGGIVGRGLQAHQADDRREVDLVGLVLQQAGARARLGIGRPQRRLGLDRLEVLEDLRRIEDLDVAVDQHRHLALGIDAQHLGMLGLVQRLHLEGHHDELEGEPLLMGCNLGLGAEHAERSGIELHGKTLTRACPSSHTT